ncbi:hypothetical protein K227x_23600 [Rubripirellula lacrimiformis]|uniref:Type IV / VI secretion system DotU domain-containing protein n=1 Tax=Rubripirellula lacrimiformis TaxID=1930273 RepID=A0A517NA11_9BACT|nr:DotU family type IV/VI secretion system protein [Rubripirellula lacrimiformis]QDT03974.1 hypothetical protein K227x_23600 [Rubripirellula lacrimiformis]
MKKSLDQFVDDYFESLLAVIDAIQAGESVDPVSLNDALTGRIKTARQSHFHDADWESAIYALVALTDELMLDMPWSGRVWWNDHVMEASTFGSRICSERFYQLATEVARDAASRAPGNNVLRVFHDCVLLGFRGVYSVPELSTSTTKELGIPPTIEDWLAKAQMHLSEDTGGDRPARQHRQLGGATPNTTRRNIVWWTVAAGLMLIANVAVFSLTLRS